MKSKAEISTDDLVNWMIVIVVFIVLFFASTEMYAKLAKKSDEELCTTSALAMAKTKFAGVSELKLSCPRRYVEFSNKYVTINNNKAAVPVKEADKIRMKKEFDKLEDYMVYYIVSEELTSCFNKLGKGNIPFYNQDIILQLGKNKVCVICASLNFNEAFPQTTYFALYDFAKTNKNSKIAANYYDHLYSNYKQGVQFNKDFAINSGSSYYIIYQGLVPSKIEEKTVMDTYYSSSIIPSSQLLDNCEYMVN